VPVPVAAQQQAGVGEPVVDALVGLAHGVPRQPPDGVGEPAVRPHRIERRQARGAPDLAVDLTEGRGQVHDPRALGDRDEVPRHDPPPVGAGRLGHVVEGPPVAEADQPPPLHPVGDRRVLTEHLGDQRLGDQLAVDHGVDEVRMDGGTRIGQQRPGGGRPGDEPRRPTRDRRIGPDQRQQDVRRLVLLVGIDPWLAQLVARQRGAAARAVRDDLEVLVQQPLLEQGFEVPPHRLHVVGAHGPVGVAQIDPVTDPRRQLEPVVDVGEHRLAAQPGEFGDADLFLDLALPGDTQALFDLHLHRQAVRVPSGPAGHPVAPHGPEAAEQVLVDARPDVMQARPAVGGRRTLVEDPRFRVEPLLDRAFEHPMRRPVGEHLLLDGHEVGVGGNGAEHGGPLGTGKRKPQP
jgi:hypothetical protein